MQSPVIVLSIRVFGYERAVADIIRTTLGPRSMLKMLLDASGGIVVTNDGNAILRELDIAHPAAKSMIELSRTQDEEVGDGTTSIILTFKFPTGEMLHVVKAFIDKKYHPTVICRAYVNALEDALAVLDKISMFVDDLALDATTTVGVDLGQGIKEVDIKKYIKVEKIPGGQLEDSKVLKGVMFNKDVVVPGKMKRKIINPRVILLDCPLEYKKGENQTNAELVREEDWAVLLKMEDGFIRKPLLSWSQLPSDIKGKRNNRIARHCGAVIVNRPDELQESDVGTGAGLFEVKKIGDEFFAFIVDCKDPKACTVLLRGASKEFLNEVERNLQHANGENAWTGIDGNSGEIADMKELKIWDAYNVKAQTFKTAIEAACMLLRIDDIVSGIKKRQAPGSQPSKPTIETGDDADNEQMIPE
ncbi:T-complex protein 1 subunit gamma [Tanacetum coccineum]